MISLIICTRHPNDLAELRRNVDETIGTAYQWIVVDNSENRYSLCAAYNEGVRQAEGELLCFMHDDIVYHTHDWGKNVERHFQLPEVGMIGVAGSHIIPAAGDWRVGFIPYHVLHFVQRNHSLMQYDSYFAEEARLCVDGLLTEVAVLDGVWFCLPKRLFDSGTVRFDDRNFTSFHIYDTDISMQVVQTGRKLYVVDDVLLEHNSKGVFNESFVEALQTFFQKWEGRLPVVRGMEVDTEQLSRDAKRHSDELAERISSDHDMVTVINYWKQVNAGNTPAAPLTQSQQELSSFTEFLFMKNLVKYYPDKQASRAYLMKELHRLSLSHRCLLLWKYFLYRVLCLPFKQKSMNMVIANGNPTPAKR